MTGGRYKVQGRSFYKVQEGVVYKVQGYENFSEKGQLQGTTEIVLHFFRFFHLSLTRAID